MAKRIVIANWKANPATMKRAETVFRGIVRGAAKKNRVITVVCPPYVYLPLLMKSYKGKKVSFGVQDIFDKEAGAYTGEVTPPMIRSFGVEYAIIGHSERRAMGENNALIARKVRAALEAKLKVVLCIGEHERTNEGDYLTFIRDELVTALKSVPPQYERKLLIAYEPIWAIGKNARDAMTPEQLYEMMLYIRKLLHELVGPKTAATIPILYGGSVKSANTEVLLRDGGVSGLLVGSASLDVSEFGDILDIAQKS